MAGSATLLACGGHTTVTVVDPPDGSAREGSKAGAPGTASVQNGGEPTNLKHAYAVMAKQSNGVFLMLFLTDKPRTCADHLAGVDYVGAQDLYTSVRWLPNQAGPAAGTWYFTKSPNDGERDPSQPQIMPWFLEHQECGQGGAAWGSVSVPNEANFLTLTEVGPARVAGSFITQVTFSTAGWTGPRVMYLHGSFETVPCVVPSLEPLDPSPTRATLPSTTCR